MSRNIDSNFEVRKAMGNAIKFSNKLDADAICKILEIHDGMLNQEKERQLRYAMQNELKLAALQRELKRAIERINTPEELSEMTRGIVRRLIDQQSPMSTQVVPKQTPSSATELSWMDKIGNKIENAVLGPIIERLLLKQWTGSFRKIKPPKEQ